MRDGAIRPPSSGVPERAAAMSGEERYSWLNRVQAVGKGALEANVVTYDWYEIR